jgi:hypothetical protein
MFIANQQSRDNEAAEAAEGVGNVKNKRGSANVLRKKNAVDIRKNDPVFTADTVKTFDNSRVKILFIDDSLIMIGENSSYLVSDHFKEKKDVSVFRLVDGAMNVIVGQREFEVHTKTAIAAARGTSFLMWIEGNRTGMAVTEGKVDLSNIDPDVGGKRTIRAGRTSFVEIGKPPVVEVKTHPSRIKKYYEQTLEPEERWGPVMLRATGSGIPPSDAVNPAQARLMALRAARVEALRNLLEQSYAVTIIGSSTIQDFATKSDFINSRVKAFIKGAWIAEERKLADGAIEVDMEIALGIGFRRMFLQLDN